MRKNRYYILWILILAAALRFVQIGAPPVGRHAWRQSDTASVARNFHQNGHRLLYPQIDWEIPGYVEMEFPVYPWVTSLFYRLTGEWIGMARLLAVLGSLLTIGFLYLIVRRILGRRAALWSAFLYSVLPLNLFFGRAIMPESWMLAASVGAVYFFLRWVDEEFPVYWWLALLSTALACLLKPTSLYLGLPLLWLAWQKWGRSTLTRASFWLFGLGVMVPLLLWYGHAYDLGQEFGASFHVLTAPGSDKWGTWSLWVNPDFYHRVFVANLGGRMLTWVGFLVFLVGLASPRRDSLERLFDVWLAAVVVVLLLASGGTYQHGYYSLPILLPAAAFMGKVVDRGWDSRRPILIGAIVLVLVLSGYRYFGMLAEERQPGADFVVAEALAQDTSAGDLVISCNSANPVWLYLSRHRGWGRDCSTLAKDDLQELTRRGANYLVARDGPAAETRIRFPLAPFFQTYHSVLREGNGVFLARLINDDVGRPISWRTLIDDDFASKTSLDTWNLERGSWRLEQGSLTGSQIRRPAEARTPLPSCQVCRVRLQVALLQPSTREESAEWGRNHRGAGRMQSQASIRIWWQESGTGLILTLGSRSGRLALHQVVNAVRIASTKAELDLIEDRPYEIEILTDIFGFEVFVDGQAVMQADNHLPPPLSGSLVLRPRLGSIRLNRMTVEVPRPQGVDPPR